MKRIANFLVTVALVCIVLLLQLVPAQGRGLRESDVKDTPSKCINSAVASPAFNEATASDDILDRVLNFGLAPANHSFYHLLQTPNPIDDTRFFVRQHYRDFLVRDPPDPGGWDFWSNQINQCGTDAACIDRKRVDVSRAFFFDANFNAHQFPLNPGLNNPRGTDAYNQAFVRQCYLTYLRREPNAPPDNNFGGYDFWLQQLRNHGSPTPESGYNHLIKAFLVSIEYRNRFVAPPC